MVSPFDWTLECLFEEKRILKQTAYRWNVLSTLETFKSIEPLTNAMMIDEESTDPTWTSSGTLTFSIFRLTFNYSPWI